MKCQIVVRMTDETFAEVRNRAIRNQNSVAEQIRILIEWGLEEDDDGVGPRA